MGTVGDDDLMLDENQGRATLSLYREYLCCAVQCCEGHGEDVCSDFGIGVYSGRRWRD